MCQFQNFTLTREKLAQPKSIGIKNRGQTKVNHQKKSTCAPFIGHEEGIVVGDAVGSTDGDALGLSLGDDDGLFLMIIVKKWKLFL